MSSGFDEVHKHPLEDPEGFWAEAAEAIRWDKRWDKVLDDSSELAVRIDDAKPRVLVSAFCGIEPGRVRACFTGSGFRSGPTSDPGAPSLPAEAVPQRSRR